MPDWTEQQTEAIDSRNPQVLVSAAAGSGKTSVLIQRVMSLLREGIPLDRMLVMTFTRAAAGEMRDRLIQTLLKEAADNAELRKQVDLISRADISTLHAFCAKLLRAHFQAADVDPLSHAGEESVTAQIFDQALDQMLDALYENPDDDAKALTVQFSEPKISGMVKALHGFLMEQADPWGWLAEQLHSPDARGIYTHPWFDVMLREAHLMLKGACALFEECKSLAGRSDGPARYLQTALDDLFLAESMLSTLENTRGFPQGAGLIFSRLPSKKAGENEDPARSELFRNHREAAKGLLKDAVRLIPQSTEEAETWAQEMARALPAVRALAKMTRDTHERYRQSKQERSLLDFSDMEHLALRVLSVPDVAKSVSERYDALFVDEYQDVSRIQEAIIQRLRSRSSTLFMVGDVKQSIYRFRLADPGLFLDKFKRFGQERDEEERVILLLDNFRSHPNILDAVNLVFENAMREEATEIAYDERARLTSRSSRTDGAPVELWLIEKPPDEPPDDETPETPETEYAADRENAWDADEPSDEDPAADPGRPGPNEGMFVYQARLVAQRIKELLGKPVPGQDGERRPLRLRDVAVLLRTAARRASVMAEILSREGIPSYSDADGEYFNLPEVKDALYLMQVLDNPFNDVPLLSVLSSPAFGFSPQELAEIRLKDTGKDTPFYTLFFGLEDEDEHVGSSLQKLRRWRFMADNLPLERFMRALMRDSGLYARAGARPDGELRRANLRLLCERARPTPEPQTLHGFLGRVSELVKLEKKQRSASLGMQEDVVRVMTLHKAKGLEFPVVFIPDLAAGFSRKRHDSPLKLDAQTGLALEYVDVEKRLKHPSFGCRAITLKKNREELSEEARLLYVGMTRARERLILIGAPQNLAASLKRWSQPRGDYFAGSASCMLDWVGVCLNPAIRQGTDVLYTAPNGSRWMVSKRTTASLRAPDVSGARTSIGISLDTPSEAMKALMSLQPPRSASVMKSSVSALVTGRARLEGDEEETPEVKRRGLVFEGPPIPLPTLGDSRLLSGVQRGVAAHRALGGIRLESLRGLTGDALAAAVKEELDTLCSRGVIAKDERAALDEKALERFLMGDLGLRMRNSPQRHAEWAFTLRAQGGMLVQGVLDSCFLEDGAWVLVDYKTDWGDPEELQKKYSAQMRWYVRALREITNLPVREAWLYLLRTGAAVPIATAD